MQKIKLGGGDLSKSKPVEKPQTQVRIGISHEAFPKIAQVDKCQNDIIANISVMIDHEWFTMYYI